MAIEIFFHIINIQRRTLNKMVYSKKVKINLRNPTTNTVRSKYYKVTYPNKNPSTREIYMLKLMVMKMIRYEYCDEKTNDMFF